MSEKTPAETAALRPARQGGKRDRPAAPPTETVGPPSASGQPVVAGDATAETPVESIGPYRILGELGEGGMGVVYLAEQSEPIRRRVALKVMRTALEGPEAMLRFKAERQALARLAHPNVAQMFEAGTTEEGNPFFAMEPVDGTKITSYCDQQGLGIRDRLTLFRAVCDGVQHAHQKGILHRDLKPSNVLVAEIDGRAVPKIIDFGIAKAIDRQLDDQALVTVEGVAGTPVYMSPEALAGGIDLDTRSDVYSLGVILHQLLVDVLPFEGEGVPEVLENLSERSPARLSTRWSDLDRDSRADLAQRRGLGEAKVRRRLKGDLDWIVMRAIARDREKRYGSPAELAADIGRHLGHEPVEARPPSALYRVGKFVRRRRGVVAATLLLILSLTWGMVAHTLEAKRAEREAERAEREARAATEVSEFLQSIFAVSDPSEARGNTVTAREILDRGAERIEHELIGEPLVQARLMETMGIVYSELGLYGAAAPVLDKALALRRQALGNEHPDVASSLNSVAALLQVKGDYDAAEPLYREALAIWRRCHGDEYPAVAKCLNNLAGLLYDKGDYDGAEALCREALALRRRVLGDEDLEVAESLNSLAALLHAKGDYDGAVPLYREALAILRQLYGDDHPQVATALNNLARLLQSKGDYDAAEPLYREALAMRRRILGDEHPRVARALNNLAVLLQAKGDSDAAEPLLREALAMRRRLLGDEHPEVAESLNNLGMLLQYKGDYGAAEPLLREALAMYRRLLGDEHPEVAKSLNNLGWLMRKRGDYDAAEALYREALAMYRRLVGEEHPYVATALNNLAMLLRHKGDYGAAEPLFREALAMRRHLLGDEHPHVAGSLTNLAFLLSAKGEYDEAEALYLESLALRRSLLGPEHPDVAKDLGNLADLNIARGQHAEAEELARQAVAITRRALPEGDWRIANAEGTLGACLTGLGSYAEAEELLLAGLPILQQARGVSSPFTRRQLERLVKLYEAWGKPDKAGEYRQQWRMVGEES